MASKITYCPPSDSDDSDCYDGFYFSAPLKREKVVQYVYRNQKLYEALLEGNLQRVIEEIDILKFPVDDIVMGEITMLMCACYGGHYELAAYLVNNLGADVNKSVDSITPLMSACDSQAKDEYVVEKLVRLLLDNGATIQVSNKYGKTAFMFACCRGFTNVVRLLIKDVDVDTVDNQGCTPVFYAVENNHSDIVKLLVEAGFNTNLANTKGYTPKQVAEFHGFSDLLALLPPDTPPGYVVPTEYLGYYTLRDHVPRIFLKSDCPEFFQDISVILNSVDLSDQLEYFAKARISLAEFLIMDDNKLRDIGIKFPICRKKILKVILDFHLHHWSKNNIARVKKNGLDNFYEILMLTANHLQHLVIIQASMRFVLQNQLNGKLGQPSELSLENLQNNLKAYHDNVKELIETVKYLGSFSPSKNPLYIEYDEILAERKRNKVRKVFKYTIVLGISVFICVKCKWFV